MKRILFICILATVIGLCPVVEVPAAPSAQNMICLYAAQSYQMALTDYGDCTWDYPFSGEFENATENCAGEWNAVRSAYQDMQGACFFEQ